MFKKLKDKLAEEVKSSPQRIQQFAQAAQAAVTSASSSISDITNNDLFSIGENDGQQHHSKLVTSSPISTLRHASPGPAESLQTSMESADCVSIQDTMDSQRQRRLSNSSIASDVSFRFPSYESPSMYHLQSDMEISASEAEERGFASGSISLDRVTKEQIYAAYRRTQDRYKKYRTQYADLARHYKLLERENVKAKSVLVETQDKALRRISELREQCALEQSAKAHLEKVMRDEIDEKNMKIGTLDTKIKLLQNNENVSPEQDLGNVPLINLSVDNENNESKETQLTSEIQVLNTKIEKMEQLLNKYKESLKSSKDKNSQLSSEIKILSIELESKKKENGDLKSASEQLIETRQQLQYLTELNEQLQNKVNAIDFNRKKEMSCLEEDFHTSQEELEKLRRQIEIFTKREEENAISLAENKLRIHKELESKEAEIKSLKDNLSVSTTEIESLNIVINDYKNSISSLEDEKSHYNEKLNELELMKRNIEKLEIHIKELTLNCQQLENHKSKADEEYKCLQLQLKQETAEKLAMIDRNTYLENRNSQLQEENSKRSSQILTLEKDIQILKKDNTSNTIEEKDKLIDDINTWKSKYHDLESEIQEEREELVKLQTEIEKLLINHENLQDQNSELSAVSAELKNMNKNLTISLKAKDSKIKSILNCFTEQIKDIKQMMSSTCNEVKALNDVFDVPLIIDSLDMMLKLHAEDVQKYSASTNEINNIAIESARVINELKTSLEENEMLKQEVIEKESKIDQMEVECLTLSKEYEDTLNELTLLKNEKQHVLEQAERSENRIQNLQETLESETDRCLALQQESEKMITQLQSLEDSKTLLKSELETIKNEQDITVSQKDQIIKEMQDRISQLELERNELVESLKHNKSENQALTLEIEQLKDGHANSFVKLETSNTDYKKYINELEDKINTMENEKSKLNERLQAMDDETDALNNELHKLREAVFAQRNTLTEENQDLTSKLEEKCFIIKKLEESSNNLAKENTSLRMQSEKITDSVKQLESELDDVRKSHSFIESEKEKLSAIIDKLEKSEKSHDKEMQTDTQNNVLEESCEKQTVSIDHGKTSENITTLKDQNDTLRGENKRLQSDVTGLQAYLAKISKENSILNDKLRDLISSGDNCLDKDDTHRNITESTNEAETSKGQIEELLKENNILIEENMELKDQLKSQNRMKETVTNMAPNAEHDMEYKILREKYNSTSDGCRKLESRLSELEQMNRSINANMQNVQDKNDKLRLTNEKLERRLDEALVSLRHLHSLQENTELEYLRNILYEYLTGTGSHSLTLAKVLSAVVKFDDLQTQQVLLKEKERQGLLRQLGLL